MFFSDSEKRGAYLRAKENVEQRVAWKAALQLLLLLFYQLKQLLIEAMASLVGRKKKNIKNKTNSKIQPKKACRERKNLPIFTLSRLLSNTRLLIWLLSLH